jgi:hypothetical protein
MPVFAADDAEVKYLAKYLATLNEAERKKASQLGAAPPAPVKTAKQL